MPLDNESTNESIAKYLRQAATRKLHIGCGSNLLPGWLNTDLFPRDREVVKVDAMSTHPFEDETFDYLFSEHIIEHVPFDKGERMLKEHHRVLKKNGRIRIATPNLKFLFGLLSDPSSEMHASYVKWASNTFIRDVPFPHPTFVINNFVRAWGHQFIYDEAILQLVLERAGFTEVKSCVLQTSDDPELRNLENEQRMPAGFLKLESIILEGTKPVDAEVLY